MSRRDDGKWATDMAFLRRHSRPADDKQAIAANVDGAAGVRRMKKSKRHQEIYNKAQAHSDRGLRNIKQGKYEQAIVHYDKAIASSILHETARYDNSAANVLSNCLNNRGVVKFDLHRYEDAIEDYDKALEVQPNNELAKKNRKNAWHHLLQENPGHRYYRDRYLKSKAWSDKRDERLSIDKPTCADCGRPAIDVYHQTYENLGKEPLSDLVSLCRPCHDHRDKNAVLEDS